ncbi:MAG: PQQ-binding-like beta-propeller repeat protein [Croceibacterium sp.]
MARSNTRRYWPLLLSVAGVTALGGGGIAWAQASGDFAAQAAAGRSAYAQNCAACHGSALNNGEFAPVLKGPEFLAKWGGASAAKLEDYIHTSMPPANPGGLPDETYHALAAFVLQQNGATNVLPAATTRARGESAVGGLSTRLYPLPPGPKLPDRFAGFTPVTEAELSNPAPADWPAWRRSHLGLGYSPLTQIDTRNVGTMRLAWAQALPAGVNMNEPLVRGGVLYVFGFGDQVFAFDAASGRQLWRYQRRLPKEAQLNSKKTIALYGDKLLAATSDNHIVALDARTGRPMWDVALTERTGLRTIGGPLAADGVVMQGLASQAAGGGLIAGFDIATGKKLWSFDTVAKPGQLGGDSWNGVPGDQRKGGSVWTSGSYDPVNHLALWGVGNTYDTGPLRDLKPGMNNDALFTESTLAFEPHSGKLVWYYQHNRNDQYDLDWVFDRVIGRLDVAGKPRRVVITGGKSGLFDALDAATGKYLKTYDMGIQDYIDRIDPVTGDKHVKAGMSPGRDKPPVFMCPHGGGGRNWSPTSWNPQTRAFFVNARDVCTDLTPTTGAGLLSTGVNAVYAAPPNGDGKYGVLQAIDFQNGKLLWEVRRRQTPDMGILTTAGGIVMTGWMDRQVVAYDQRTGKELWSSGVTGVPNASPITYSVDGKQYIAIVTGAGNPLSSGIPDVIPETQMPSVNSSSVYVFALPDQAD